ncbi:hypothetical protein [Bradyrhizobium symbiodeficiens]|uniref:Uncharacterized protein n=1 Tax=Bradyrhizobium symbiodeficiens TaxID=1404367 RepID=A0A6G9A291_9BRAD|nr:hypothetical protein [Bradyrhizobium symbiodeficiens]QIP06561.1 hypothetical protein HAV00_10040 [Bradyrhizobium symbiodeficiens]
MAMCIAAVICASMPYRARHRGDQGGDPTIQNPASSTGRLTELFCPQCPLHEKNIPAKKAEHLPLPSQKKYSVA